jgi:hypothetical protein
LPLVIAWALGGCEAMLFLLPMTTPPESEAPITVTTSPTPGVRTASGTEPSQPAKGAKPAGQEGVSVTLARLPLPRPPEELVATATAAPQDELIRVFSPVPSRRSMRRPEPEPSREHVAPELMASGRCDCSNLLCALPLEYCGQLWAPSP